jgi:membrane protein
MQRLLTEAAGHFYKPLGKLVVARAALSPLVGRVINAILQHLPGYEAHVEDIAFSFLRTSITVRGFSLHKKSNDIRKRVLDVPQVTITLHWRDLLKRRWIGMIDMDQPNLFVDVHFVKNADTRGRRPSWKRLVQGVPFCVERLRIGGGQIHFYNIPDQGPVDVCLSDIFLVIKNISNSLELSPTLQSTLECRAAIMQRGRLDLNSTFYPFAERPTFDLDMQVRDVALEVFNPLFRAHLGTHVQRGALAAFAEMAADKNEFRGYVKPLFENLLVDVVRYDSWLDSLRAKLIRAVTRLLKNKRVDQIATKIEFSGDWLTHDVDIWGAIGKFLANAFRHAFRPTLENTIRFAYQGKRDALITINYRKKPLTVWQKGLALLQESAGRWSEDQAARLSAALSYYATFSLAPLLILIIAIAGLVFGPQAAQGRVFDQLAGLIEPKTALAIQGMIQAAWVPTKGILATLASLFTLFLGATGVLLELKKSMNKIWRTPPTTGFGALFSDRLRSMGLILGVGFLMVVSLLVSAIIAAVGDYLGTRMPMPEFVMQSINVCISFFIITVLFAMIYKWLPDTHVAWRDVWIGSAVTSLLFSIGKLAFGIYIGKSGVTSTYGAAGSIVVILLWVYYSAMILYFGSEFTAVYAEKYGSRQAETRL